MTIALTPEIETALAQQSQRRGLTLDELAQQLLRDGLQELEENDAATTEETPVEQSGTLADRFAGRLGVISGKGLTSARDTGKQFTEILLQKRQAGKL